MTTLISEIIKEPEQRAWLTHRRRNIPTTYYDANEKKNAKSCLLTKYKMITSILKEIIKFIECMDIFPLEQKAYKKES